MAAQYGCIVLVGQSGNTYEKDIYADDTANNDINMDTGTGATSTTDRFWIPTENVVLKDFVLAAATAQTKTMLTIDGRATGTIFRNSLHLASIAWRPPVNIGIAAGQKIALKQLA